MLGRRRRVPAEGQDSGVAWWTVGGPRTVGPFDAKRPCRSLINKTALRHYINNFDFSNLRLDQAFRYVCVPCGSRRG